MSEVNWHTEIRFLIRLGETRTLLREKGPGRVAVPVEVTGSKEPLPTTMDEGYRELKLWERLEESEVMWEVAPELKNQSVVAGWFRETVLKAEVSDC